MRTYECAHCGMEYDVTDRRGRGGRVTECNDCAQENTVKFTGNMIYDHKTGCSIQINTDPTLTQYIIKATKLQNKGSNLGNNLKVSYKTKGEGRCLTTVAGSNAKGKQT
jgi:DNA-directed RNA polymerase subunit RPC12/RpoP